MYPAGSAPTFAVPMREIVALEHPMVVKNIDNGLRTLGSSVPLQQLLSADGYEGCFPLYLRTVDPTCAPLLSNNTPSSNVLLKITVPKRTGRKRRRGSDEPYTLDPSATAQNEACESTESNQSTNLRSHSRLDNPNDLLQSLKDNVGKYHIEPVGTIDQTHRYRGMTDFHYSTTHGKFMTNFRDNILPGNVESLRKFKLDLSRGVHENEELIPPPTFSDKTIPVNWGYHQNSTIKVTTDQNTGELTLINQSRVPKINTFYVPHDTETVPTGPPVLPPPDPILNSLLGELQKALDERPIWTRRAIMNRIPRDNPGIYLLKPAIQYIGYQFRGGPWRDAIVRYGIDPRRDPSYRIYQTIFFKIIDIEPPEKAIGKPWHDKRSEYTRRANPETLDPNSHVFDGTSVSLDGKIWQVCDITDPLLERLLSTPVLREQCDLQSDGWFCNGTWAKVRAVMRTKISAIRIGREMLESDFAQTLAMPDDVKDKVRITAHMPNIGLKTDGNNPGDGEVEALVEGTGVFDAVAGMTGKAWRRRKIKGNKRRVQKGLSGTTGTRLGFGRAGSKLYGRNLGAGGTGSRNGGVDMRNNKPDPRGEGSAAQHSIVESVENESASLAMTEEQSSHHPSSTAIDDLHGTAHDEEDEGEDKIYEEDGGEDEEDGDGEDGDDDGDDDEHEDDEFDPEAW